MIVLQPVANSDNKMLINILEMPRTAYGESVPSTNRKQVIGAPAVIENHESRMRSRVINVKSQKEEREKEQR